MRKRKIQQTESFKTELEIPRVDMCRVVAYIAAYESVFENKNIFHTHIIKDYKDFASYFNKTFLYHIHENILDDVFQVYSYFLNIKQQRKFKKQLYKLYLELVEKKKGSYLFQTE